MVHVDGTFGYRGLNLFLATCRDPRLSRGPPMILYGALHKSKFTLDYTKIFMAVKVRYPKLFEVISLTLSLSLSLSLSPCCLCLFV